MLDRFETRVPPVVWLLVCLGVVWVVSLLGERLIPEERSLLLAVVMVVLGIFVAAAGVIDFATEKTSVDPLNLDKTSYLVTEGVFRFSRNPMYLGMLCIVISAGLWLESLASVVVGASVFVACLTRLQIIPEERSLKAQYGSKYSDYIKSVRRWI